MYGRFAAEMPRFLRQRVTLADARANIARQMAAREANFLRLLERAVFARPASPYFFLFREAGCDFPEAARLLKTEGLEAALGILHDAGVSLSFDEIKGRVPLTRGGRTLNTTAESFDNPFSARHYEGQTSGSTGTATRVNMDLAHVGSVASSMLLAQEAHGIMGAPCIIYSPGMPSSTGFNNILRHIIVGNPVRRWFSPVGVGDARAPLRFRVAQAMIPSLVRACGHEFPRQEIVPFAEAVEIARAAADLVAAEGRCLVRGAVSSSHTVALAAVAAGIDLTGVTFAGSGEPPSQAKVNGIQSSGARYVTSYSMNEAGPLGVPCANPADQTDVHFLKNRMALIQRPHKVPGTEEIVSGFSFTSLLPTAPKLLINAGSDDFGIVEERACGCPFDAMGLNVHVRQVRSARKLTGRGITLLGSDIASIIEEKLPGRFGGNAQDFQLIEEEDRSGRTKLVLLVSPSVTLEDERAPAEALLEALSHGNPGASLGSAMLRGADALTVRREKPRPSARGKLPAFRTVGAKR